MVMIRVTQNMVTGRSLTSLQAGLDRLAQTQEKLSTGKNPNRPSDSPTDATTSMRIRVQLAETQQHVRNAQNGLGWLDVTDTTLSGMADNLRRVSELALQGANASITGTTSGALATEVAQIREGLLAQANTTYLDRPIFGGVTAGTRAFDASGAYVGADAPVQRSVADGVKVRIDISGTTVVGPNGANLFDDLAALENALRLGDKAGIQAALGDEIANAHESELLSGAISMNPMLVLIGILGFVASFAISIGPVMWVLFSELFPNKVRGLAISFVGLINSGVSFLVQLIFPWELANLGSSTTFLIYGVFGAIGVLFVLFVVPETKGKSLEELEHLLVKED